MLGIINMNHSQDFIHMIISLMFIMVLLYFMGALILIILNYNIMFWIVFGLVIVVKFWFYGE